MAGEAFFHHWNVASHSYRVTSPQGDLDYPLFTLEEMEAERSHAITRGLKP